MPSEPALKRTVAFVDGQNLFHAAREAVGYTYPTYDVRPSPSCRGFDFRWRDWVPL